MFSNRMKTPKLMKFLLGRYRKQAIAGTALIAAIAAISAYSVTSGHTQTPTASKTASGEKNAQFITRAKATTVPRVSAKASASPKKNPKAKASPSPGSGASAVVSTGPSSGTASRSPYTWPFSWESIWNIPIASTAEYAPADIKSIGTFEDSASADYDSISPAFPVVTLENAELASGSVGAVSVYGDPAMTADGEWNTCSAFLGTDGTSVYQGETTELTAGGNPSFGGTADAPWAPVSIEGTGIEGCHGGSGLSGLGGTLTLSDLTQSGPITHALKVALDGSINLSSANGGFRWPAANADTGFNEASSSAFYGGSNPDVQEGSLLALPRSISPSSFSNPIVAKIAEAMQDYGAYIVDDTGTGASSYSSLITNYNSSSQLVSDLCGEGASCGAGSLTFSSELDTLLQELDVVTNNTSSTPGGGVIGASRCAPYAPEFTGGSDAPPSVAVTGC